MSSAFFGLNTALRGLVASQQMLETAAHNTANANTPGFSRQRAQLVATPPYTYPSFNRSGLPGQIGTGVAVATITRVRDAFLDLQIQSQSSIEGGWATRRDELAKVESVVPEPSGSGLGTILGRFWDAWQEVAADPSSSVARAALVEQARSLGIRFSGDAAQLATLATGIDDQLRQGVATVSDLASQVATLNAQIQQVQISGDHANDLEDQRNLLLDKLAQIVPITLHPEADGTVTVLVGGTDLVSGNRARAMTTGPNGSGQLIPTWTDGTAVSISGGQLAALVDVRDRQLASYRTRLDTLAAGVADAVNALHATGFDAAGNPGSAFFTYTAGNAAATLSVSAAIASNPALVAAAGAPGQPGNGTIAGAIADLRTGRLFSSGTQTASDFYASLVGGIGTDSRQATEMAANQSLVTGHLRQRRESISGVSLDEEAADMIRFQHAYAAAARVITTFDEMLDTLINKTGVVGR